MFPWLSGDISELHSPCNPWPFTVLRKSVSFAGAWMQLVLTQLYRKVPWARLFLCPLPVPKRFRWLLISNFALVRIYNNMSKVGSCLSPGAQEKLVSYPLQFWEFQFLEVLISYLLVLWRWGAGWNLLSLILPVYFLICGFRSFVLKMWYKSKLFSKKW